jgi:hypothetical protein
MSSLLLPHLLTLLIPTGAHRAPAPISDLVGVYALIDRVVVEGDSANPRAIQVWGVFSLADRGTYMGHTPAQRGYLYYTFNATNERASRAEWADLKSVAGSGQTVAFGGRNIANGRVRPASEAPVNPDMYPLALGVNRLPSRYIQPQQISDDVEHELKGVPAPQSPTSGARVAAGSVRLVARNSRLQGVQYVFEITGPNADAETSTPLPPGSTETSWAPKMQLRAGSSYTWRVWTVQGSWHSQSALVTFRTN